MRRPYSDSEIIEGIKNGNQAIEESFYSSNFAMIREMVRQRDSHDRFDPQDIYQEGVATLFVKAREGKLDELNAKLSTYLYSVCFRTLMYKMRQMKTISDPLNEEILEHEDETIDEDEINMQAQVIGLIKDLKPPCDGIIKDRYLKNMDYEFIATKYGYKNSNSAKKKSHLCMQGLREKAAVIREKYI
jgi:RNA polymerase sigma factor (sigma-70 family)